MTPTETLSLVNTWRRELAAKVATFDSENADAQALSTSPDAARRFFTAARGVRIAAGQLEEATRTHLVTIRGDEA